MPKQTINVGSGELTGNGESLRAAFVKINNNFNEVYSEIDGIVVPTVVSAFSNDVGYIKDDDIPTALSQLSNDVGYITTASVPRALSSLTNDVGYITTASVPRALSSLTNDVGFIVSTSTLVNGSYTLRFDQNGSLVFPDNSAQYTAWTGIISVNNIGDISAVSITGSYLSLIDRPAKNINFVIDGGGAALATGSKGYIVTDLSGTIDSWTILADTTGTVVVDVKKSTYAAFPATTSIASSDKPTLTDSQKNQNNTLTVWTTSISSGNILEFVVDSASTVTRVVVNLRITET
jgi:hypothetical protein